MAVVSANTYLITLDRSKVEGLYSDLIFSGVSFEILDPTDLGEEWEGVQAYESEFSIDQSELDYSQNILSFYDNSSPLESLLDNRVVGSDEDITYVKDNFEQIKEVVHKFNQYLDLKDNKYDTGYPTEAGLEDLELDLSKFGIDPNNITEENLKLIAAYHTYLEIQLNITQNTDRFFSLNEESKTYFAFIGVDKSDESSFADVLGAKKVAYEVVDWNKQVVVWKNKGGLSAFQSIAQSLGTIDKNESDPTISISIFFTLFFAFCLSDAFYGAILAAFCGYFIYFRKPLKKSYSNIFRLFFYSGLATILFGALINSWAGNFASEFGLTQLNSGLSSIQILDILNPDANLPVNNFLRENGNISPVVFMLGFSAMIGLVNSFVGYILKINNSLKASNWDGVVEDTSWLLFISSVIAYIIVALAAADLAIYFAAILGVFTVSLFIWNTGNGLVGKIISGFGKIYGVIGFFADMLSFTRLMAVGLTSGIIANVINLLANLVFTSIDLPVLDILAVLIVLAIGHSFNLVVSLFGAYINPLRLHYVEYMPKFYEGRGRSLRSTNTEFTYMKLN